METKHTKGEWKVIDGWDKNGKGCFPSVIIHGTEKQFRDSYGRNGITINCSHDQQVDSIMANAKLIAAAPEMLEALIEVDNLYSELERMVDGDVLIMLNKVRNAITKATK